MIAIDDCDKVGGYKRKILLVDDHDWGIIAEEPCRAVQFTPSCYIKDGKYRWNETSKPYAPYATVLLDTLMSSDTIKGYITNKTDFTNLWKVFKERAINENEEVIIVWTKNNYKYGLLEYFSIFLPKLWIFVYHKGFLEFISAPSNWEQKGVEQPSIEEMGTPIVNIKPKIME